MATYYVDSTRPDDTGAGTSEATAKKTLAAGCALITAAGDVLNIKASGSYTPASTITLAVAGTAAAGPVTIRGYTTTPGDGGVATITSGSATEYFSLTGGGIIFQSLKFIYTGTGARAVKAGSDISQVSLIDCEFSGCSYALDGEYSSNFSVTGANIVRCKFSGGVGPQVAIVSGLLDSCYIVGSTGDAIRNSAFGASGQIAVLNSVITGCSYGINLNSDRTTTLTLIHSIIRSSTNDNIKFGSSTVMMGFTARNSVIELAGGYGINATVKLAFADQKALAFRSNTSGNRNANVPAGVGDITLTGDPWTAAGSGNFATNTTAGSGAALRNAGYPGVALFGTGYDDVGPLRHQDPAGGGLMRRPGLTGGING